MLNPATYGGGASCRPPQSPPALVFCPLHKISLVNPYLKILDRAKLFVADAPIKKIQKIVLPPLRSLKNLGPKTAHGLKGKPYPDRPFPCAKPP